MKKHVSIRISGLVQGVFFRASTEAKARELNIAGFVQNEKDGSVYVEAEGEQQALERFVEWCHRGPDRARVDNCEVVEAEPKGYTDFTIRR